MPDATPNSAVSAATLAAFRKQRALIIQTVVARSLDRHAEVSQHGDQAERLITAGIEFTTQTLEAVMQLGDPTLMDFQLAWAQDRLPHDGVAPAHLLARLRIYAQVVAEVLTAEQSGEVIPYLTWMIERQQELMA